MLELFLWLLPPFIFVLLVIKWTSGWAARVVGRNIEAKMRAAERLVNLHTTPDDWLASHRAKLAGLQARGAGEQQVARAVESARRDCLRRIDALIGYFGQGAFVDSPQTRDSLVSALRAERERMEKEDWQALLVSNNSR
jgi:hypothetical protein